MKKDHFEHTAKHIKTLINGANSVLLIPHQKPDGDALGSSTAFAEFLTEENKSVTLFCKTEPSNQFSYLPHFHSITTNEKIWEKHFDLIIIFDSGDLRYAGVHEWIQNLSPKPILINIDHHATNELYGDFQLVDTRFSSTCEAVFHFFTTCGIAINQNMATSLLTGIITDTDHFVNSATTSSALSAASFLMKTSHLHTRITENLYKNMSQNALKLWGEVFLRLEKNETLGLIYTFVLKEDIERFSISESDMEGISNFLNSLGEEKASLVLKQTEKTLWKGSFRTTKNNVDVARIAKTLGGGGHKKAAGFEVAGTQEEVFQKIFETMKTLEF